MKKQWNIAKASIETILSQLKTDIEKLEEDIKRQIQKRQEQK